MQVTVHDLTCSLAIFLLNPEYLLEGPGRGPVDYAIEEIQIATTVGVTEVKNDDFGMSVA